MKKLMKTRGLLIFLLILSFLFLTFVAPTSAQFFNDDSVDLSLRSNRNGTLIVDLETSISEPGEILLAEITFPEFLVFRNLIKGDANCTPELVGVESSYVSVFCLVEDGADGFTDDLIAQMEFEVVAYGDGEINVEYAEVDNFEVSGGSLKLLTQEDERTIKGGILGLDRNQTLSWLLLIAGSSVLIILLLIFVRRRKSTSNEQLLMLSVVGMFLLTLFSAIMVNSPTLNYDVREEAFFEVCEPMCTNRSCGDDGCGGECGSCPEGFSCDLYGDCIEGASTEDTSGIDVDDEDLENVQGVSSEQVVNNGSFTDVDEMQIDQVEKIGVELNDTEGSSSNSSSIIPEPAQYDRSDLNFDGEVDLLDYSFLLEDLLLAKYGSQPNLRSDLDQDGDVDVNDLLIFKSSFDQDVQ